MAHNPATVGGVVCMIGIAARTCLNLYSSNRFCPWQLPTMFTALSRLRGLFPQSSAPAETSSSLHTSPPQTSSPVETCSPLQSNSSPPEIRSSLQVGKFAVKMLLGGCQIAKNDYRCTCKNGKFVSGTGVLDKTALCDDCIHPMYLHGQFTEESHAAPVPSPRAFFSCYPQYCPRTESVQKIATLLNQEKIVHIRGTPASGKILLANFLYEYFFSRGQEVYLVDEWPRDRKETALDLVLAACLPEGHRNIAELIQSNLIIILDEAQYTYRDSALWYKFLEIAGGNAKPMNSVKVCLLSSYGSPTTGAPHMDYLESINPPVFSNNQRISLVHSSEPGSPNISLFFTKEEYSDVVNRYCEMAKEYVISDDLAEYIFMATNGHPGMVMAIMDHIFDFYQRHLKRTDISILTMDNTSAVLVDNNRLFGSIANRFASRSFPIRELLGTDEVPVVDSLLNILKKGYAPLTSHDYGLTRSFKRGFIHTTLDPDTREMICVFPSPLHARYVEFMYGQGEGAAFPKHQFPGIEDLCKAIVRGFSRKILCQIRDGRRLGTSGQVRPLEASFQDEFYRSFWREVPNGGLSREWSLGGNVRVDFFVIGPGWGVELLRDGDRLDQHCSRFKGDGAYYADIDAGIMKDWLILDFRHDYPRTPRPTERRLWRVVFNNDYSRVNILDCENNLIEQSVLGNW